MSVPIIKSTWERFNNLKTEDFTARIILALSMSGLVKDFDSDDIIKLEHIRDITHKKINTPIYVLDRYVDETKGNFTKKTYVFNDQSFTQDDIQYYLCLATEKINAIIYKNFKDYKTEEKAYIDKDDDNNEEWD